MERLRALLVLGLVFLACFFATTALLDWVCWHVGYYDDAAKEAIVIN